MKAVGLLILCILAAVNVWSKNHEMQDCHRELKELCKDKHGAGMFACIKKNKSNLSSECQQKIEEKKAKWKGHSEACKVDREKYCEDIKPGSGRLIKCMQEHIDQLSPECKAHVEKEKAEPIEPAE